MRLFVIPFAKYNIKFIFGHTRPSNTWIVLLDCFCYYYYYYLNSTYVFSCWIMPLPYLFSPVLAMNSFCIGKFFGCLCLVGLIYSYVYFYCNACFHGNGYSMFALKCNWNHWKVLPSGDRDSRSVSFIISKSESL